MAEQAILGEAILNSSQAAAAESTPETVEDLVVEHTRLVFRIAYSVLRNSHDAEDAAQECFLRALKYGSKVREIRSPKTWLARIAWTVALDRRARRAASTGHADQDAMEQRPDPGPRQDEQLERSEMHRLLEGLIAGLPEDLRLPLELSTVRELNSTEIAHVLGIPEGSVRTRLMRARGLLKEKMERLLEVQHG